MANDGPYPCPRCSGDGQVYMPGHYKAVCSLCRGTGQAERPPETSRRAKLVRIDMEEEDKKRG